MKKLKNIKCILLDIDGTLTNDNLVVSDNTKEIIKKTKEKGILVVLCTGRPNQYAIEKSKMCNGSSIVIADNGAIIYDYEQSVPLFLSDIPQNIARKVWNISMENDVDCVLNTTSTRYRYSKNSQNTYINGGTFINDFDEVQGAVTQIVINSENHDKLFNVRVEIDSISELEVTNTNLYRIPERGSYFCDINLKGNSKGKAIHKLMHQFNFQKENLICFGDSMNDYPMFEACGYCVAMKNAEEKLKKQSDFVTEYSNNADGVALFIKRYIID